MSRLSRCNVVIETALHEILRNIFRLTMKCLFIDLLRCHRYPHRNVHIHYNVAVDMHSFSKRSFSDVTESENIDCVISQRMI